MAPLTGPVSLLVTARDAFKAHWKVFALIAGVPSLILYIGQAFFLTKNPILAGLGAILSIAGVLLSIALRPAIILAIQKISAEPGAALSFKEQYKAGFRYFWPVLGLSALYILISLGSGVLFVIPAIVVSIYISMYLYCRIIDGKKGFSAFTESYSLVKGRWVATLGRLLFFGLAYFVMSLAVTGVLYLASKVFGFGVNSETATMVTGFLNIILNSVMLPVAILYNYSLYASLKATRIPQPSPSEAGFRKWLIAFMVLGLAAIIIIPIIAIGIAGAVSGIQPPISLQ